MAALFVLLPCFVAACARHTLAREVFDVAEALWSIERHVQESQKIAQSTGAVPRDRGKSLELPKQEPV